MIMTPGLLACAVGVATCFFSLGVGAVPCSDGQTLEVTSTADAQALADALDCTGGGAFDVIWYGRVELTNIFEVADGISLKVTGSGSSLGFSPDSDASTATIIGPNTTSETGIFNVSGASLLTLDNIVLRGGYSDSQENDGAGVIKAQGSDGVIQTVNVIDCHFVDNYGSSAGAISARDSAVVNIYGTTSFTGNMGFYAGAIMVEDSAVVNMYGTATFNGNTGDMAGSIYAVNSAVVNNYGTPFFTSNTALSAGAVYIASDSQLNLYGASTFFNNSGDFGGALVLYGGDASIDGRATFTSNTAGYYGGAVYAASANLSIEGAVFTNNMAGEKGGAIYATDAKLSINRARFSNNLARLEGGALVLWGGETSIGGNTIFTSNTAGSNGGAVYLEDANVSIKGAVFSNNAAARLGGALLLSGGNISIGGNTRFTSNTADKNGGAIYVTDAKVNIEGAVFSSNMAGLEGGAISAYVGTRLHIEGVIFSNNEAGRDGGAMLAQDSTLNITGGTTFTHNTASGSGGGLAVIDCEAVSLTGSSYFSGNVAPINGGAISMDSAGYFMVDGATFARNKGGSGGSIWALATNGVVVLNVSRCTFEENSATDGGALYLFDSGEREAYIKGSGFHNNTAVASGGAIYHTGALNLDDTQFVANKAYVEGMAIASLGIVYVGSENVSFERNALYCPPGEYGYDKDLTMVDDLDTCRAEVVCTGCSTSCDNVLDGLSFASNSTVPAEDCKILPVGTIASSAGTTVSTLELAEGYYRTSNESHIVLECYQNDACNGGLDATNYCVLGYTGPYCAVCAEGYGTSSAHTCHKCSGETLRSAVALVVVTMMILLGIVVAILSNLVAMVPMDGSNDEEQQGAGGLRVVKLSYLHKFLVKIVPLTSVKIVVVVWQILTQFSAIAGAVYPDEYERFLSILSPINMDIGFVQSISCLADTNFYDRLLLSTTMPLMSFAVLAGTYAIAKKRNRRSEAAVRAVQHKHLSAALFVMFLVYSSVSFTVFQSFVCDTLDDGVGYLRADYSLTCGSVKYNRFAAYAKVMVVVYPIGIPAAFTWWLVRNRRDLSKPGREAVARLQPFSGIWAAYRPSHFYYEVVECGRRIALTGTAAFVLPGSSAQIAVVLLLVVVFSFVFESMQPFQDKLEMTLYRWGNGVVLGSMYVALLRKVDVSGDSTPAQSAFAMALIAGNVCMVVAVLVQSAVLAKAWHASNEIIEISHMFAYHIRNSSVSYIQAVGDGKEAEMDALHVQMENT